MNRRAFCWTLLGLLFPKARNCLDKRMLSSRSPSFVRFCLPFAQKIHITCEMAPRTVPSARSPWRFPKNHPDLTAIAIAPSMRIHFCWEWGSPSMKKSLHPTDVQYFPHHSQAQDLLSCVPPITACLQVRATAVKSARSWFCWGAVIISKCAGICLGKSERKVLVSAVLSWCQFLERASVKLFFFPGNPWLYLLTSASINNLTCCWDAWTQSDAWSGFFPALLFFSF